MTTTTAKPATITQRVINAVTAFPGYAAAYYCDAAGVTRAQFRSVARRHLRAETQPSRWVAYFPATPAAS